MRCSVRSSRPRKLVTMATRTMAPILAPIGVATQPMATTDVTRAAATVAATGEALFTSVATLSANMSSVATVMGAIAIVAVIIRMAAAIGATVMIHTEAMEGLGAMATAVSGAAGQRRIWAAVMERTPRDMTGRRSVFKMRATTTSAVIGVWKSGHWSVGES